MTFDEQNNNKVKVYDSQGTLLYEESAVFYAAAHQGITGVKEKLDSKLISNLKNLRNFFKVPIAVGFGISKKKHLKEIAPYADIAVVGSAIINLINKSNKENIEQNIRNFVKNIRFHNN